MKQKNKKRVKIGNKWVGDEYPTFITAEIGLNHNGDLNIAKKLIDMAVLAGCDAVKFQKRNPDTCVPKDQKNKEKETPWGTMTYLEYRHRVEFGKKEYKEIDKYCKQRNIIWFASSWDIKSVDFLEELDVPCYKIASPSLTDDELLQHIKSKGKPIILSTGMSTIEQIKHAVKILGKDNLILLHCTSTYPSVDEELNLRVIPWLKKKFNCPIGYSGHESGVPASLAATILGACMIERHIALDRAMWGSDQAASLEPNGLNRLVRDMRRIPVWFGDGKKRVFESEKPILEKLRKIK